MIFAPTRRSVRMVNVDSISRTGASKSQRASVLRFCDGTRRPADGPMPCCPRAVSASACIRVRRLEGSAAAAGSAGCSNRHPFDHLGRGRLSRDALFEVRTSGAAERFFARRIADCFRRGLHASGSTTLSRAWWQRHLALPRLAFALRRVSHRCRDGRAAPQPG